MSLLSSFICITTAVSLASAQAQENHTLTSGYFNCFIYSEGVYLLLSKPALDLT